MKLYILFALLPCIWAADLPSITCPDGKTCPVGQTCCENSGHYECCDLPEEERQNKKLVPALMYSSTQKVSHASCFGGTLCNGIWCCPEQSATCCSSNSCCPSQHKCCGSFPLQWCCKSNQRCASKYMYCQAGASALSPAFASLLVIFFVAVTSKHFY